MTTVFRNYLTQLFADESAQSDTDVGTNQEQAPEEQAPETPEPEKKYSDADVDKIISQKFAKWEKQQAAKVSEAQKLAEMNAQQKAEYERDQLQKQIDEFKRKDNLLSMNATARKMLSDDGVVIPDELVSMIITEDAESTEKNVKQFGTLFKTAVAEAVANTISHRTPTVGGSGTITKEQIMNVKDRVERQKLINENIDLFK